MIPQFMNCRHSADGWCLDCVQEVASALVDKLDREKRARINAEKTVEAIYQLCTDVEPEEDDNSAHLLILEIKDIVHESQRIAKES